MCLLRLCVIVSVIVVIGVVIVVIVIVIVVIVIVIVSIVVVIVIVVVVVEYYILLKYIIDVLGRFYAVRLASAPCIFSRKILVSSSRNGRRQNRSFCCWAPVEAPRSFFPFLRFRRGEMSVRVCFCDPYHTFSPSEASFLVKICKKRCGLRGRESVAGVAKKAARRPKTGSATASKR